MSSCNDLSRIAVTPLGAIGRVLVAEGDIADGYHRVSLAYALDPYTDVPLKLETPCDRRLTDVLTKMLTRWLAKTSGSCQTRRSPGIPDGVSEGTRTPDTQDHNLVL
jgi:hypothetical protein